MRRFTFEDIVKRQYAEWVKKSVLAYEEGLLASKYPEYKALVKEYHDGIILYEVMSDMVWNKAVKDTTGLKEFMRLKNELHVAERLMLLFTYVLIRKFQIKYISF